MSDVRIVKLEDLPDFITQDRGESQQTVKIIIEEDGKAVLYTLEIKKTAIPF